MRTVVIGASSGLGRCIAIGLAEQGARVALMARRAEALAEAAEDAGGDALAIPCDVTDEDSVRTAIARADDELGGIDALVYAAGIGTLGRLVDVDAAAWRTAFDTNVIGAALVTAAALPSLERSGGTAAFLTSNSSALTPPWPGLGPYVVSKAALNKLVDAFRAEHPGVGFTQVVVGECAGGIGDAASQFADQWDTELAGDFGSVWIGRAYMSGALVDVSEVVRVVDTVLRCGPSATIPVVAVTPRPQI